MSEKDLIFLEEMLLGYLRSSKKISLKGYDKTSSEKTDSYTLVFEVDKDFGSTLVNNLNNQFADFFKANNKDNERKTP